MWRVGDSGWLGSKICGFHLFIFSFFFQRNLGISGLALFVSSLRIEKGVKCAIFRVFFTNFLTPGQTLRTKFPKN